MNRKQQVLSSLPSVDELLRLKETEPLLHRYPRSIVTESIRECLKDYRSLILQMTEAEANQFSLNRESLLQEIVQRVKDYTKNKLVNVVNATGVILHTNLGRAVLSEKVRESLWGIACRYSNLEYQLESGERGSRYSHIEELLCRLTGAEAAMVVNNNAAALLLVLSTLAKEREVVVSRGQLVEIGGSFRVPDVMLQSGTLLKEVGTTNKTHLWDYEKAVNPCTAALLKVHTSNYRILGFTEEVAGAELVKLGRHLGIPVIEDLGSGVLVDLTKYGLPYEPTVQSVIADGMDIVTFSGDKLLGGPQGGIILGKMQYIERIRRNPLTRALRIDKLTLAALEATLRLYLDEETAMREIPVLRMLSLSTEELEQRSLDLYDKLYRALSQSCDFTVPDDLSEVGGGSMPLHRLPTKVIAVCCHALSADKLEEALRKYAVPVIARIRQDKLLLDVRTILEKESDIIVDALKYAVKEGGEVR